MNKGIILLEGSLGIVFGTYLLVFRKSFVKQILEFWKPIYNQNQREKQYIIMVIIIGVMMIIGGIGYIFQNY